MQKMQLMATLWPSFPHFERFAKDDRLSGIRLDSAKISIQELRRDLALLQSAQDPENPLYFDVKGRQLRVTEVHDNPDYLDITINHPIRVETPIPVFFKGGNDQALMVRIEESGHRLIFQGGPQFMVEAGESIHIHDPKLISWGQQFIETELQKIDIVRKAGFKNYFLSYVQRQRDVDQFRELVGRDARIMLKIEDKKGLEYVAKDFRKEENIFLVAARGDLFVELGNPFDIVPALRLIAGKDPEAYAASRILLSVQQPLISEFKRAFGYVVKYHPDQEKIDEITEYLFAPQPTACADICELTWLADIGYRNFMLCDELCLHEDLLGVAIDAFDEFRESYVFPEKSIPAPKQKQSFFKELLTGWGVS